jgi:dihydroxyacetone kinase-like predicted kinase
MAALMHLNPDGEIEAVTAKMSKAIEDVTTVEVTTSTRTVEIDGVSVEKGQVIAMVNGKLAISATSVEEACLEALALVHANKYELITLFHGETLPMAETNRVVDKIRAAYPAQEIELQDGGQPHYQFIISIE